MLDLFLANSRILYFWHVLKSTHKFIIEGGLIKNKGEVGLFKISQKERFFNLLWQLRTFGGHLTVWPLFLHSPRKAFLSPSVWPRREHTWTLNWKQSLLICFESYHQGAPYSHTGRVDRKMNTLIMVITLTLYVRDS